MNHKTLSDLEAGLPAIRQSPKDVGVLQLIVRRPVSEQREVLRAAQLDVVEGLVGDSWRVRTSHDSPDFETQLTLMNSRAITLIAGEKEQWPPAGDQLFVDLDLSGDNLPPGTRLAIGEAIVSVTAVPHTGCRKFSARFGSNALKFVNSAEGRRLNLRGVNAKIVQAGAIRVGDRVMVERVLADAMHQ